MEQLRKEKEEKLRLIAEKKRQVEELKRRRAERSEQQRQAASGAAAGTPTTQRRGSTELGRSVDSLVAEILGNESVAAAASKVSPAGPLRELAGRSSGITGNKRGAERTLNFSQEFAVASVLVEPQEANVYDRSVQTEALPEPEVRKGKEAEDGAKHGKNLIAILEKRRHQPEKRQARDGTREGQDGASKQRASIVQEPPKELTVEERERVLKQPEFNTFFDRTTKMVERVIGQQSWDMLADFGSGGGAGDGDAEDTELMKYVCDFSEERWARSRAVTDVQFSPHAPEWFLASYQQRENPALADPDGCMLVWNLTMQARPEAKFTCQSAVLTATFHRFDRALFFGGTYAGGVVLWDARAKAGPVLRTPLSGKGHAHPVQAMQQVGTQNATNLVTASNDGRLCVWSLAMPSLPQETVELKNDSKSRRDLAVTCLCFPENETNTLYVGAEDGSVCQVHIHGSRVGVTELYDGHEGPVTGLDMHPHHGQASMHGMDSSVELALTCSFDWSVKLWMVKQQQPSPILSLDTFEDYVYDVSWHPAHPAVFSSVDGEGHVDLWNLNANLEAPVMRCEHPAQRRLALNRVHWSKDGSRLATGDSEGTLSVYTVDRTIAQPRSEVFQTFQERVRQLQPIVSRGLRDGGGYLESRYAPPSRNGY